jgi:hypothetical protein
VIEVSTGGITVRLALLELIVPAFALTVVLPVAEPVAMPVLEMVAPAEAVQITVEDTFCVVPLVKVPVAVNCCESPFATETLAGVTATDTRAAGATVKVVEPVFEFAAAVMLVDPCFKVETWPAAIVATVTSEEVQVAVEVKSCVVESV